MNKTVGFEHSNFGNSILFRSSNFGFRILNILCLLFAFLTFTYAEEVTKIIAKVNNQVITSKDLDDYCKILAYQLSEEMTDVSSDDKEFKKKALLRLIEDRLILSEAKKEKIDIPRSWIDDRFNRIIFSYPSREEFEQSLVEKGLTITLLKEKIKEQYLMREIIEKKVKSFVNISPQEISRYYADNIDKMYSFPEYVFYIAKAEDESTLIEMSQLIQKEGILKAEQIYEDSLSKVKSRQEELREEIFKILKDLKEKEYQIAKIDKEYYLVYLEKRFEPRLLSLEEVKEQIYSYLWQMKFQKRFNEWVEELREKAVIKIYYE